MLPPPEAVEDLEASPCVPVAVLGNDALLKCGHDRQQIWRHHIKSCIPHMPVLYKQCINMRRDVLSVGGMSEAHLKDADLELSETYASWCYDYKGPDLADSYMGFCEMIRTEPLPWSYYEESSLNGLRLSQFHLVWAYSHIESALTSLGKRQENRDDLHARERADSAAVNAVIAAKALTHAKALVGAREDCLAQAFSK